MSINTLAEWHKLLESGNADILDDLLADDAVMISPVVHTYQRGKAITKKYLQAASHVIGNEHFKYVREFVTDSGAVLEFETEIDGRYVNGIDMISWNEEGQITEFKVMIRPLQGIQAVHEKMGELLAMMSAKSA